MSLAKESIVCQGGYHGGVVRFQVLINPSTADECNCSICRKKFFLHLIFPQKTLPC